MDAVEAANHDKSTDDCGFGPLHVTAYGPPTAEVFDAPPGGPTYRAEVHPPAETRAVRPGRAQKPAPAPRAVEVPESHAAVGPYLSQLLAKKHYLRKTPERLAREMAWLFSKPVAFALRHVQDSLGSQRPGGAWDALDFTGCEAAFSRWQQDERIRAQAQGPNTPAQPTHRPAAHQSPVFGERRLTA